MQKGDRYRLFQFKFTVSVILCKNNIKLSYKLLEDMSDIDIQKIRVKIRHEEVINTLFEKLNFKTKDEFYEILEFDSKY